MENEKKNREIAWDGKFYPEVNQRTHILSVVGVRCTLELAVHDNEKDCRSRTFSFVENCIAKFDTTNTVHIHI